MNMDRLRQWHLDNTSLDDLAEEGLISPQEKEYLADYFAEKLMAALAGKGHASHDDVHCEPLSEILKRFRKANGLERAN